VWGSGWKEGRAHEEGLEEEGEELGIVGVGGDAAAGGHDEAPEGPEGVDPLYPRGRVHQHLWGGGGGNGADEGRRRRRGEAARLLEFPLS